MADDASGLSGISRAEQSRDRANDQLRRQLGPKICGWLADPTVIEVMLNADGELWVERLGQGMERGGRMSAEAAEAAMATIAATLKTTITALNPILECELPLDGSRFEGVIAPIASAPTFAIRLKATKVFTLDEYVTSNIMTARQRDVIEKAIAERQNILVVGGTGSGKTTLTNAILDGIARLTPNDRLVILEDTNELQCAAPNKTILRSNASVDLQKLLKVTMRMRPDRIIVGEVRGGEALALIKAWNTGHPGGAATVHANDARSGLTRIESLVAEARQSPAQKEIAAAINVVVVIGKTSEGRRVRELRRVLDWDGQDYLTEVIEN
jgi:type IV secretion system protein VirB11